MKYPLERKAFSTYSMSVSDVPIIINDFIYITMHSKPYHTVWKKFNI